MPNSVTRKNSASAKKNLTAAQKKGIRNSLAKFKNLHNTLSSTYRKFNAGKPPSEAAMLAALKALARQGGGTRRRSRR